MGLDEFLFKKIFFWLGKGSRSPGIIIGGIVPSLSCPHVCVLSLGDTHSHTCTLARMHFH